MSASVKSCLRLAAAAVLAFAPAAFSGEEAVAAGQQPRPYRIGVVRIQDVFDKYEYKEDQEKAIKAEFSKDKDDIDKISKLIDEKMQKLKNDNMIKPGGKEWQLEMLEIEKLKVEFKALQDHFKDEFNKRMAQFYRTIYENFRSVVDYFGQTYQFDLIVTAPKTEISKETLESDNPVAIQNEILLRNVQYIGKSMDITDYIVNEMNKRYREKKAARTPN